MAGYKCGRGSVETTILGIPSARLPLPPVLLPWPGLPPQGKASPPALPSPLPGSPLIPAPPTRAAALAWVAAPSACCTRADAVAFSCQWAGEGRGGVGGGGRPPRRQSTQSLSPNISSPPKPPYLCGRNGFHRAFLQRLVQPLQLVLKTTLREGAGRRFNRAEE